MIDIKKLKSLKHKKIKSIYLHSYFPFEIESRYELDIKLGLFFEKGPSNMIVIDTDSNDCCSPKMYLDILPDFCLESKDFEVKIKESYTRTLSDEDSFYFDFTDAPDFEGVVDEEILDIQYIMVKNLGDGPIGLKFVFKNNYITSSPNAIDGNTIETKKFNKNNCFSGFEKTGEIYYVSI